MVSYVLELEVISNVIAIIKFQLSIDSKREVATFIAVMTVLVSPKRRTEPSSWQIQWVSMVVIDVLMPNRRQVISRKRAASAMNGQGFANHTEI